jgi:protein-S-isoprenylcysteine O-methyltransferase Ste14
MTNDEASVSTDGSQRLEGLGCAGTIAVVNLLPMGLIAYTFAMMTYSNAEQEGWYRGGSLAFLIFGAILRLCWLILMRRGYWGNIKALIAWMLFAMLTFMAYVLISGGGV